MNPGDFTPETKEKISAFMLQFDLTFDEAVQRIVESYLRSRDKQMLEGD